MTRRTSNMKSNRLRGNALIEFTLVGIPIIFVLISIFEISRGMWIYHSLAYAAKSATRYASVHGKNCATAPNSCQVSIADVARTLATAAPALIPAETDVTFSMSADPGAAPNGRDVACVLNSCLSLAVAWPNDRSTADTPPVYKAGNAVGNSVTITIATNFRTALSLFWPGTAPVSFGLIRLSASSTDQIQF
jgi:Flp pilus assembly protein TadG